MEQELMEKITETFAPKEDAPAEAPGAVKAEEAMHVDAVGADAKADAAVATASSAQAQPAATHAKAEPAAAPDPANASPAPPAEHLTEVQQQCLKMLTEKVGLRDEIARFLERKMSEEAKGNDTDYKLMFRAVVEKINSTPSSLAELNDGKQPPGAFWLLAKGR